MRSEERRVGKECSDVCSSDLLSVVVGTTNVPVVSPAAITIVCVVDV